MHTHHYYQFLSTQKTDQGYGANLRKHAGSLFLGLLKDKGNTVWESVQGCKEILDWAEVDKPNATGETLKIINYNIREMDKALKAIQKLKS